jgi:gliding motility associated protien GldN
LKLRAMKRIQYLFLSLFLLPVGFSVLAQPVSETPRNSAYDKQLENERRVVPYDHIREIDVFWEKRIWRIIDTREKLNLAFVYPKRPLIQIILDAVEKEGLPAYSSHIDDFSNEVMVSEIISGLSSSDTLFTTSIWTGLDTTIIFSQIFDPLTVRKFRLQEVWIFDEETSTMVVRILGIAPVRDVMDINTGEFRGESDMFWIYYPDARQILANANAYNPHNDAVQMSWEDIFEMRMFSSYIVKESNVYDRPIESYATGIDAVLESERIKLEIFKKEHELWEF